MRVLLTGMSGTVAPRFAAIGANTGHDVVAWNRAEVSPDDSGQCRRFVDAVDPAAIVHMAFGAESWAGLLAASAQERGIPFVFTSTAMVFAARPDGPYSPDSPRTATDEYGGYKIRCEDAIRAADAGAMVARIGYQIDAEGSGNNMVAHLDAQQSRDGHVLASNRWIPACAFLDDTATALWSLLEDPRPGVHHLDSNAITAWTYLRIVAALARTLGRPWQIIETQEPDHDQRLVGPTRIADLTTRLP